MSDLVERLRDYDPIEQQLRGLPIQQEAADEIERLRNELDDAINKAYEEFAKYEADIERLRAVVDAAKHLLAGGDKEAVYHLERALAALKDEK